MLSTIGGGRQRGVGGDQHSLDLLWCVIGMVGATHRQINIHELHSHTGIDLHDSLLKLMVITCACRSLRLAAWYSFRSSDLARSVSRRVVGVCRYPRRCWGAGWAGCSRARVMVRRWWICHYSSTSLVWCGGSSSKTARGHPRSTCHRDMCLGACSRPVHRLTKPRWQCCFFGSGNGGCSGSLSTLV
jgi:hypothetical protein